MHNASTSTPTATPDNLSSSSDGKVNTLSADKQAVGNESSQKSGGVPEREPDEDIFDYAKRVADIMLRTMVT